MDKATRKRRRGRKANEKLNAANTDNGQSREDAEATDVAPDNSETTLSKERHRELTIDGNVTKGDSMKSPSDIPATEKRQRGKKRKGRKDTSDIVNTVGKENEQQTSSNEKDPIIGSDETKVGEPAIKQRRCIGRKPITDFVVGQTYAGKVVYIKPFGLFLDIGCHSDAFCHVSRVSDSFVESIESMFKIGDDITNARIIDVNRKAKRITVSLQSENRVSDEMVSMKLWKERMEKRENKKLIEKEGKKTSTGGAIVHKPDIPSTKNNNPVDRTRSNDHKTYIPNSTNNTNDATHTESHEEEKKIINESTAPADIKRARKIARRAERREKSAKMEVTIDKNAQ